MLVPEKLLGGNTHRFMQRFPGQFSLARANHKSGKSAETNSCREHQTLFEDSESCEVRREPQRTSQRSATVHRNQSELTVAAIPVHWTPIGASIEEDFHSVKIAQNLTRDRHVFKDCIPPHACDDEWSSALSHNGSNRPVCVTRNARDCF